MGLYFDSAGNVYQIDDEKVVTRKKTMTLHNERGETFEIASDKADEYKLTPNERQKVVADLRDKAVSLSKTLGICPVIDPACIPFGHIPPCPTFCGAFGCLPLYHHCLAFDPMFYGTVRGTPYMARSMEQLPQATQVAPQTYQLLQSILEGCPNIDPVNLGTVIGTLALRDIYRQRIDPGRWVGGCTMMDPPDIQAILGTIRILEQMQGVRAKTAKGNE